MGDLSGFSDKIQKKVNEAHELTSQNTGLTLNVAANYGGRWDMVNATKEVAKLLADGSINIDQIDEALVNKYTSLADQPDLDLLIRTSLIWFF